MERAREASCGGGTANNVSIERESRSHKKNEVIYVPQLHTAN